MFLFKLIINKPRSNNPRPPPSTSNHRKHTKSTYAITSTSKITFSLVDLPFAMKNLASNANSPTG